MLAIINKFNDDEVTPMMLDDDAWFVTHAFNGNDELEFTFSEESGYYDLIEEESKVLAIGLRGRSNRFVVKNIDSHDGVVTVNCDVDLYDWQKTIFDTYGGGKARTLEKVLQDVTPEGWSYSGQEQFGQSEVFQTGSREPVKAGTPLDVLDLASEVYGCVFNFDNIANHLYVIDAESYKPSGDFLSDEVNLKSLGYVGNSEGYATRLYPYGKRDDNGENPVTIESVNGGLPYVTNNEFSNDIICVGWSDERYTDPEHLKEAAIVRLAEVAAPTRSYECDVSQLNRNVWLYMVLTMIDRKHRTRVDQQVVEWKEYGRPDLDVVTLSAVAPSLESLLKSAQTDDDAIYQYVNGVAGDLTNAYEEAIENATDKITGNEGGYFKWIFDAEGRPIELVNLGDSMDINNAKAVWRWNQNGLGHSNNGYNGSYGLALLADGSINASMMTVGIIQGGQSHWNLNTGDLDVIGRFRTRSDSELQSEYFGVDIDPSFGQDLVDGGNHFEGSGIRFPGSGRYQNPYIATEMQSDKEGQISAISVNGGQASALDPGAFVRIGTRRLRAPSGTSNIDNGTYRGTFYALASSRYSEGSGADESTINIVADSYDRQGNRNKDATVFAALYSKSVSGSSSGLVGIEAQSVYNGANVNYLHFGGRLGGGIGSASTFMLVTWNAISIGAWSTSTPSATVTPPRVGTYRWVVSFRNSNTNNSFFAPKITNQTTSGFDVIIQSGPPKLVTDVDAHWKTSTSTGAVSDLSINTSTVSFFASTSKVSVYLAAFGILG